MERDDMHDEAAPPAAERQAAEWFLRRRQRTPDPAQETAFQQWLTASPENAQAFADTQSTWRSFDDHATLPELVVAREQALASVRRVQAKRWANPGGDEPAARRFVRQSRWPLAAAALVAISVGVLWKLDLLGGDRYGTGIGEQRTVLLPDSSSMVLDAMTNVRVHYSRGVRLIEMHEGQAQFDVAADGGRPFRVRVGGRTIEALGTSFTVTYIDKRTRIALLDGRVKVGSSDADVGAAATPAARSASDRVLKPGDALSIDASGRQMLKEHADPALATAWRQGKIIFQQEPLREAVERLNRYSRVRLQIADPSIDQWPVSGIFGAGDAEAFADALASYFPIQAHRSDGAIELRRAQ